MAKKSFSKFLRNAPFSKTVIFILLIFFSLIGFYIGMQFQKQKDNQGQKINAQAVFNKTQSLNQQLNRSLVSFYDITLDKPEGWVVAKEGTSMVLTKSGHNSVEYYRFNIEEEEARNSTLASLQKASTGETNSEWTNITIGGHEALMHTYEVPMVSATSNTDVYLFSPDKKKLYTITQAMYYIDTQTVNKYRTEFMQIVSTITFN